MKVVILTLLSAFLIQFGYFLWKIAADRLPRIGEVKFWVALKGFFTNWLWLVGFFFVNLGWVLFVKVTEIGEITLIQPLMNVGDLFLILLAVVFLHERLVKLEWAGLFLTLVGVVAISSEATVSRPANINWLHIAIFISMTVMIWISLIVLGKRMRQPEVSLGIAIGIGFTLGGILTKLMTTAVTLSGQPLTFVSCVFNPLFPLVVAANVTSIILVQMAFQRGRAAIIIPIQVAVIGGVTVLAGMFLFSEVVTPRRLLSILIIASGTVLLQYAGRQKIAKGNFLKE